MMSRGSLFTNIILTISFGKLIIANTELAGLSMFKNLLLYMTQMVGTIYSLVS